MAETIKTASTIDITLTDSEMGETTFKINTTATELATTLAQIRSAYAPMLGNSASPSTPADYQNSHLFTRTGLPFVFVTRAKKTIVTTTESDIT